MFRINLTLTGESLSGRRALTEARRLGLPDSSHIDFTSSLHQSGAKTASCNVSEGFAAAWFDEKQCESKESIPFEFLAKGDAEMIGCNNHSATWSNLSADRISELYVAARFDATRKQINKLQSRIRDLELEVTDLLDRIETTI